MFSGASPLEIGEPLLGYVGVPTFLIDTVAIEGSSAKYADDRTEYVGLLEAEFNEFR